MKRLLALLVIALVFLVSAVPAFAQDGGNGAIFFDAPSGGWSIYADKQFCDVRVSDDQNDFRRLTEEGTFFHYAEKSVPLVYFNFASSTTMTGTGDLNLNYSLNGDVAFHIRGTVTDTFGDTYQLRCKYEREDGVLLENSITLN